MKIPFSWLVIVFLTLIIIVTLCDRFIGNNSSDKTDISKFSAKDEILIKKVQGESKIYEAIITESRVLYVSVIDDGTSRDGFAQYLCTIVKENFSDVKRVKVVKVNSLKDPNRDNAYGVLLGESWCR